jgi:cytosine/adenosine deaminase-related metal-dependent hydrolase
VTTGFVNAHTHLYSGLAPLGMPAPARAPGTFLEILEPVWWRLDRALDARSLRAAARYYVAEALRLGTVALVDHHESPNFIEGSLDVLADACQELGMPALLCYGATERNGGRAEARRGLAECRRFIRENRRPLVRGVVGLHASFTVSDETIEEAGALCDELGTVLHVHLAEDRLDVEDAWRRGYEGPLRRLATRGALPRGSMLAHGVHLTASEVRETASRGCWLVQNPRSNRGNRVGYPGFLGESARVALGTDGYPSDGEAELEALREGARGHGEEEAVAVARADVGRALFEERFGAPTPAGAPAAAAGSAGAAAIASAASASPTAIDIERITAEAAEEARRLWERMAAL